MELMCKPEEVGLSSARLELIQPWIQTYFDAGKLPEAVSVSVDSLGPRTSSGGAAGQCVGRT